MGVGETLAPATGLFATGLSSMAKYAWVLYIFVGLGVFIFLGFMAKMLVDKKRQWTHTLKIRRVDQNDMVGEEVEIIKMRRFPLIKRAEVFQLEKPLLGAWLISELDQYSGKNEYSVILDMGNRIWINQGSHFIRDKCSMNVSAKHGEIDLAIADLTADYADINRTNKRIEWSQIAKYAMLGVLIIAVMIISIKGIGAWGEAQDAKAISDQAQAAAMQSLADAMKTSEGMANVNLMILDLLKKGYGTNNLQPIIKELKNGTIQ